VQCFQENSFLLRCHKGVIVFNLRPMGNFDKLPGKFTFFQALVPTNANLGIVFICKLFQSRLQTGQLKPYDVSSVLFMSR